MTTLQKRAEWLIHVIEPMMIAGNYPAAREEVLRQFREILKEQKAGST